LKGLWIELDQYQCLKLENNKDAVPLAQFVERSAIRIAHNPVQHDRTKHTQMDRHFIKEKPDSGLITPYVSSGL